jgi:ArsR family transcriptional regulator
MEAHDAVKSLAALAQPVRLQVFRALVVAGPEGMTPGALIEAIAVPGTSLSFHLKELLHSGMVTQERNGRHLVYRAAFGRMSALIGYLTENCCEGEPCASGTAAASGR